MRASLIQLRSKLNSLLLSALLVMAFVLSGQAASPPSGAFSFELAEATIFDLSGTYPPTAVSLDGADGTISDLTLNVDSQGKITGTGSMHVHTDERGDAMSADAIIAVSGRIQSGGEVTRVRLKLQMKDGKGTEGGQPMTFSITLNFQGEIQESLIEGKLSGGGLMVVNGRKKRVWSPRSEAQIELLEDAEALLGVKLDGIEVQSNIVSGTGQVILNAEGETNRFFNCRVTGRHDQATGITRLSLRGDKEKGSAGVLINVIGESGVGNSFAVHKYSGKLMGQRVRAQAAAVTDQPSNRSATAGDAVSFTVKATGSGLSYQWRKDGVNLDGATGATLNLGVARAEHAGSYSVVISNALGSVTSSAAVLTVNRLAQTITFAALLGKRVDDGPFSLAVTSSSGLPVSYSSSDAAVATVSGNTLTITGIGSATITASQAGNAIYLPATDVNRTLAVGGIPAGISSQPTGLTVDTTSNATFSVTATGTTPLAYQWRKDGVNLIGATGATLDLGVARAEHAGSYSVVISNALGSVTSSAANLTIISLAPTSLNGYTVIGLPINRTGAWASYPNELFARSFYNSTFYSAGEYIYYVYEKTSETGGTISYLIHYNSVLVTVNLTLKTATSGLYAAIAMDLYTGKILATETGIFEIVLGN